MTEEPGQPRESGGARSPASGPGGAAPGVCPRCGAPLRDDQDWCLECGAAARTRLERTTAWRVPVGVVAAVAALCLAALAFAFIRLANTDDDVRAAKATTPAAAIPPAETQQQTTPAPSTFGPTGATGATGPTGATGATGATGPTATPEPGSSGSKKKGARAQP